MENPQNADTALLSFFETVLWKCDNNLLWLSPRVLHIIVDAEIGCGALVYLVEEAAVGLDLVLRMACVTYFQVSPLVEQGNCFQHQTVQETLIFVRRPRWVIALLTFKSIDALDKKLPLPAAFLKAGPPLRASSTMIVFTENPCGTSLTGVEDKVDAIVRTFIATVVDEETVRVESFHLVWVLNFESITDIT